MLSAVVTPVVTVQVSDQLQVHSVCPRQGRQRQDRGVVTLVNHAPQKTLQSYVTPVTDWYYYLSRECFHRCSFKPVNCNVVGRVQSSQTTIMKLAYWKHVAVKLM